MILESKLHICPSLEYQKLPKKAFLPKVKEFFDSEKPLPVASPTLLYHWGLLPRLKKRVTERLLFYVKRELRRNFFRQPYFCATIIVFRRKLYAKLKPRFFYVIFSSETSSFFSVASLKHYQIVFYSNASFSLAVQ